MSANYANIGGEPVLKRVVSMFYEKVLADGRLAGFFSETDMARLEKDQVAAFGAALGGPVSRHPVSTKQFYQVRGIDHGDFDLVVCYLADALREAKVPDVTINETLFVLAPLARDIVSVTSPNRVLAGRDVASAFQ